jgi:hypothetical protein
MSKKIKGQGLNKEKLVFLAASILLACALYMFLAVKPIELLLQEPRTEHKRPFSHVERDTRIRFPVDYYVVEEGSFSDQVTNQAVKIERKRRTPFAPNAGFTRGRDDIVPDPPSTKPTDPFPPSFPPQLSPPPPKEELKDLQKYSGKSYDLAVSFMGIAARTGDGNRIALLRMKDGGPPRRVQVGDVLDDLGYKITKIGPESVWLSDGEDRPYILKNEKNEKDGFEGGWGDEDEGGIFDDAPPKTKTDAEKQREKKKAEDKKKQEEARREELEKQRAAAKDGDNDRDIRKNIRDQDRKKRIEDRLRNR